MHGFVVGVGVSVPNLLRRIGLWPPLPPLHTVDSVRRESEFEHSIRRVAALTARIRALEEMGAAVEAARARGKPDVR